MWPVSLQTKHQSLLEIMLTVEDIRVAVTCYAVLNLSTRLMNSDKRGALFVDLHCSVVCIPKAFNKDVDDGSVTASLSSVLNWCIWAARVSLSLCWISMKHDMYVCMIALQF